MRINNQLKESGDSPKRNYRHGHKPADGGTREYHSYLNMKARCGNPKVPHYHRYGGNGVTVCARWQESFENFLNDMGRCPSPNHSLDRIDNSKGYYPANCRWATPVDQANNRRSNRHITHNGETMTCAQWSRKTGIKAGTIHYRLKSGWPIEKVLS